MSKTIIVKFRGRRFYTNDLVEGYFILEPNGTCWIDHYPEGIRMTAQVIPESVEQLINELWVKVETTIK